MGSNIAFMALLHRVDVRQDACGMYRCVRCDSGNHSLPSDGLCYSCRQELLTQTPVCCPDVDDGKMLRQGEGWLCVWCGREAPIDEPVRQWKPSTSSSSSSS